MELSGEKYKDFSFKRFETEEKERTVVYKVSGFYKGDRFKKKITLPWNTKRGRQHVLGMAADMVLEDVGRQ
ncbi:MAG: hypothetical protein HON48_14350 [Desulfobacula sp.]|jgi:hypothetical protein|nr:hypothetical protein [Desulfobacula sp.]